MTSSRRSLLRLSQASPLGSVRCAAGGGHTASSSRGGFARVQGPQIARLLKRHAGVSVPGPTVSPPSSFNPPSPWAPLRRTPTRRDRDRPPGDQAHYRWFEPRRGALGCGHRREVEAATGCWTHAPGPMAPPGEPSRHSRIGQGARAIRPIAPQYHASLAAGRVGDRTRTRPGAPGRTW